MKIDQTEVQINGVDYIRKDSIKEANLAPSLDGLKPVLIRSYAAGVHIGYLKSSEYTSAGEVVTLLNTQRIFTWYGACSLSQVALEGVKEPDKCQFSVEIPENKITNVIETIPLTEVAFKNLKSVKIWKK
jgi:hypothetical protein